MVGQSTRMYYPTQEAYEALGKEAYPVLAKGLAFETELELRRKDGTPLWVRYNGRAVDPGDLRRGALWILTDHTAQRQVDEALRESEARFRHMFESHSAVMMLVDPAGGAIVDANPAAARFYGYERSAMRSMDIYQINALPRDELRQNVERASVSQQNTFVFPHRLSDGRIRTVEINSSPLKVQGRTLLFSIVQDITERLAAEQQLGLKQAQLEELNRSLEDRIAKAVAELRAKDQLLVTQSREAAMGEMIGNIAHQWRQPLNALGLILANLRDSSRYGELDGPVVEQAVADGTRLVQKMSSTINDFRDFLRPEKEKHAFSALRQVRETLGLLDAGFRNAGIALEVEVESEPTLFGFANEYSQVVVNLVANARQAIQATRTSQGRVTLRLCARGGFGCLTVCDNGGGIPEAILDKIFEPYFSTREGGTGIGLYMSRQIVERSLGGRLEVRNVDKGAEFTLLTPLSPAVAPVQA
jgi:PAS domain S-box-containing protein